jgi:hypothetical protein
MQLIITKARNHLQLIHHKHQAHAILKNRSIYTNKVQNVNTLCKQFANNHRYNHVCSS